MKFSGFYTLTAIQSENLSLKQPIDLRVQGDASEVNVSWSDTGMAATGLSVDDAINKLFVKVEHLHDHANTKSVGSVEDGDLRKILKVLKHIDLQT